MLFSAFTLSAINIHMFILYFVSFFLHLFLAALSLARHKWDTLRPPRRLPFLFACCCCSCFQFSAFIALGFYKQERRERGWGVTGYTESSSAAFTAFFLKIWLFFESNGIFSIFIFCTLFWKIAFIFLRNLMQFYKNR